MYQSTRCHQTRKIFENPLWEDVFKKPAQVLFDGMNNYTDHLDERNQSIVLIEVCERSSVRVSYSKDPQTNQLKILEENHYYPFGLKHSVYSAGRLRDFEVDSSNPEGEHVFLNNVTKTEYQYKYNGKEFQDELGLSWYDYGARNYDPALGRWMNIDPLADADKNIGYSPYAYAINNPITYIDPDGRCWQKAGDSYVPCDDASVGSTTTGAFGHSWTMTENDGWQLTSGADPNTVNYQYDHIEPTGDKSYYTDRYKNHIEKYNTRPPDYYLEYGYNNKVLFDKTYPSMSDVGKEVFDKIGPGLQNAMNDGIRDNPSLQGSNQEFKDFAYKSHFPVYEKSGIGRLGVGDLIKMGFTPKLGDTVGSPEGRSLIRNLLPILFSERPRNTDFWDPQKNPGLLKPRL